MRNTHTDRMDYRKVHVEVEVKFLKEGGMRPVWIKWEDGRKFTIERVKFIERASARTSSVLPVRYTVILGGRDKHLYYEPEDMRWFVEAPAQ